MLHLQVRRQSSSANSTLGELFSSEDSGPWSRVSWTLEDVVREVPGQPVASWKVPDMTAIPIGTYNVVVDRSEHFSERAGHDVFLPLLLNVPGFDGVRIHGGNTAADTEGCLLVAHNHPQADVIQDSAIADVLALLSAHQNQAVIEYLAAQRGA